MSIEGLDALELFGAKDAKLNLVKQAYPQVAISHRGTSLKISGDKKLSQKHLTNFHPRGTVESQKKTCQFFISNQTIHESSPSPFVNNTLPDQKLFTKVVYRN